MSKKTRRQNKEKKVVDSYRLAMGNYFSEELVSKKELKEWLKQIERDRKNRQVHESK